MALIARFLTFMPLCALADSQMAAQRVVLAVSDGGIREQRDLQRAPSP
jgi:hypothetical protein